MSLTKVSYAIIDGAPANILDYGAVGDGVTDCSAAVIAALESGNQQIFVPTGTFALSSNVSATIATDVNFYGQGTFIYTGANNTSPLFMIVTGNNSLTINGLSFDGNDQIVGGLRIFNTESPSANTLPNCTISNNLFIRFRMNVSSIWNNAVYVAGSYQLVTIQSNRIRLITRAAETGNPGSNGTSGITVTPYDTARYVRECLHFGNQYAAIYSDDLVGSSYNVDNDAFRFFGPDPTTQSNQYVDAVLTSFGNIFRNCRGRALKIQATGSVRDETIIRDSDYTNYGGSTEINFQFGVGSVSNCQFFYRGYSGGAVSPIQTAVTLVSFYQGNDYGEDTGSAMVDGLQVFNSINPSVTTGTHVISQIVGALSGSTSVGIPSKPLISISNVSVNNNPVTWISTIGFDASAYGTLRLDNIIIPELVYSAIGTNNVNTNFDIVATNVMNIDGVRTPANAKPFMTTTGGAPLIYMGAILGGLNQGFLNSYAAFNGSVNRGPLLGPSALSDSLSNAGGSVSVQSKDLADNESFEFGERFYQPSVGLFAVSVNYTADTQGLFSTSGNAIYAISGGSLFELSVSGTNPDVDNKFNMWYTGGKLNVKNRLGDSRVATVTFMG